jgi:hypothetical protein
MEEDFRKGWGLEGGEEGDLERLERELLGEADDDVVQVDATLFPMPPLRRIWVADGGVVVVVVETDLLERKVEVRRVRLSVFGGSMALPNLTLVSLPSSSTPIQVLPPLRPSSNSPPAHLPLLSPSRASLHRGPHPALLPSWTKQPA